MWRGARVRCRRCVRVLQTQRLLWEKNKNKKLCPLSLETSLQPSAWALMSGSCHRKCSRAQITYMCIILTSFSGWAASAVIADFHMAKYQSKSNQMCCLENRRLFGFVITCDYWLVNIMTIFFTSLSNRASWIVCLQVHMQFPFLVPQPRDALFSAVYH